VVASSSVTGAHLGAFDAYVEGLSYPDREWDDLPMPADLLERQAELERLESTVTSAATGRGSVVVITGEAGIGKTSLVRAFLASRGRFRVLAGACEDLLTPRPLGPLRDAARSVPGPLATALARAEDGEVVFAGVVEELATRPGPTVLVVEDAHWADGATVDVLRFVSSRVHELPAVLVITVRDDALTRNHPLRPVLGGLHHEMSVRLSLHRLSPQSVSLLAGPSLYDAGELYRVTRGNPFFVTEVLAAPDELVPPTVVDAVLARVSRLGQGTQRLLEQVAVVPGGIEMRLLRDLVGSLEPVSEAEQAGVVEARDGVVSFRHELARRAVVQTLPAARLLDLHVTVMHAFIEADSDPFRILHHAVAAGEDELAVTYGLVAARASSRLAAHRQAAECYGQVLARSALLGPIERARVAEAFAWSLSNTNQLFAAAEAAEAAVAGWEAVGDDPSLVRALVTLSRQQWLTERPAASRASAEAAMALAERLQSTRELTWATLNMGGHLTITDREVEGVPYLRAAHRMAVQAQDPSQIALALNYLGSSALQLGDLDGTDDLLHSVEVARASRRHDHVLRGYYNLIEGLWRLGRFGGVRLYLELAAAYSRDRDLPVYAYMLDARRYRLGAMAGDWPTAVAGLRRLVESRGDPGMIGRETIPPLARLLVRQGHPDAGPTLALAAEHAERAETLEWLVPTGLAHLEHQWLIGAEPSGDRGGQRLLERTDRPGTEAWRAEVMRYLRRLGRPSETIDGAPERFAAGLAGDWAAAAAAWEAIGDPYEQALELAESGLVAPTMEALEILTGLGAAPAAAKVRRRLRVLGVSHLPRGPLARTRENPCGLTDREVQILKLLGDELSNADIAGKLVVSTRTVDHHVSAILRKLDAGSRREATARIPSLNLP
jgi:DNA-binding CsgD family transcriptional regulator